MFFAWLEAYKDIKLRMWAEINFCPRLLFCEAHKSTFYWHIIMRGKKVISATKEIAWTLKTLFRHIMHGHRSVFSILKDCAFVGKSVDTTPNAFVGLCWYLKKKKSRLPFFYVKRKKIDCSDDWTYTWYNYYMLITYALC